MQSRVRHWSRHSKYSVRQALRQAKQVLQQFWVMPSQTTQSPPPEVVQLPVGLEHEI